MAPRIKHVYKSSNNRVRISTSSGASGVILPVNGSFLESYKSQAVKEQQNEMERMRVELRDRERKILQDITTFNKNVPSKNSLASRSSLESEPPMQAQSPIHIADQENNVILSHDIVNNNETISFISNLNEMPSFITSPVIFKEFNEEENASSFVLLEKSKLSQISFIPIPNHNENGNGNGNENENLFFSSASTSPNKVPGSSDFIPSTNYVESDDFATVSALNSNWKNSETETESTREQGTNYIQDAAPNSNPKTTVKRDKSFEPFASPPTSDESSASVHTPISNPNPSPIPRSEIKFFTIDPEYLRSFKGIWQRRLNRPIKALDPSSPDHFEISMQNKLKKDKDKDLARKRASK